MSGCPSDGSVHVPVGTLSLALTGLAVAGVTVLATQVAGMPGGDGPPNGDVIIASTAAMERGNATGGIASAGVTFTSGFEPPCSTVLNGNGYIGGGGSGDTQNCDWHASINAQPGYMEPHIDASLPNNGLQHLRFQHDPNQPIGDTAFASVTGVRNWAFSDDIVPAVDGVQNLSLWVKMGTPGGGNNLIIQPQAPSQGFLTTVFVLNADGTISVGDQNDVPDTCNDEFFAITLVPGVTWVPDEWRRIDICIDVPNDRIRYFYGGEFIYSTGAGEGGVGGPVGCGIFAGTAIEHVLIRFEANENDSTVVDVDDVIIEPDNCPEPSGACCVDQNDCQFLEESQCGTLGGLYLGHGAQCDVPICNATLLCEGATGDCFAVNGTPGCDQPSPGALTLPSPSCCALVCSQGSPFDLCCLTPWQQFCADLAADLCPVITCSQPADNCQPMDLFDTVGPAESAAGVAQVADNFTPASNSSVDAVCYYGTYFAGGAIPSDGFTITYYDCVEGVPGAPIASYTGGALAVTRVNTNLDLTGPDDPIFEYTASHAPTPLLLAGTPYFIEIVNTIADPDQTWFWQTSNDLFTDGTSFQKPDGEPYARHFLYGEDFAFCLNIALGDTTGLCPIPDPIPCDLDLAGANVEENEPCGTDPDLNLGCSGVGDGQPPLGFTNLAGISQDPNNPTIIHGEAWADNDTRDVDWFRFQVPSTPDLLGNNDGMVLVNLSVTSELPITATVGTQPGSVSCDAIGIGVVSAVGFECASTFTVGTVIPFTGIGSTDLGLIIVRTNDGGGIFNGYPCVPPCPWDCEAVPNQDVGIDDFLALLAQWTMVGTSCDFDGTGVGINAFLELLANWGSCNLETQFGHDYLLTISVVDNPTAPPQ